MSDQYFDALNEERSESEALGDSAHVAEIDAEIARIISGQAVAQAEPEAPVEPVADPASGQ